MASINALAYELASSTSASYFRDAKATIKSKQSVPHVRVDI